MSEDKNGPGPTRLLIGTLGTSGKRPPIAMRRRWSNRPWLRYVQGLLLVAVATLLGELVHRLFSPANLVMIYLLAVVVAAIYLGRGPSILVAILGVFAFDFFLVSPRLTFAVSDTQDIFTFIVLFVVGLVISNLTALVREQAEAAEHRAAQNAELYALSRDLAVAVDLEAILGTVLVHVSRTFGRQAVIFLPQGDTLTACAADPEFVWSEDETDLVRWAFENARAAGRGTDMVPSASARYLPLRTARGVLGVLGVRPPEPSSQLTPDQRQLLDAFASQAALAMERAQFAEKARQAEVLQATERLQTALLNSISHDLRTPLVSILGALSSLQEDEDELDPANRRSLIDNACEEAERLNRLVGNLLDMTRIEAGALRVMREPCDVQDLIGAALEQLHSRLRERSVVIDVPPEPPLVSLDFVLMEQVLVNLLDNALKYSPPDVPIELSVRVEGGEAHFDVADRGPGIPTYELERVFDKFYRVGQPGHVSGTGLGLSICKGIVEAHGGSISARNREGGGALFTVVLPLNPPGEEVE